jgi:tRNA uridine 5-carboxymethylaminomethyl modification enzyme
MFTSRAEYRLLLREDNADERLTPQGRALGLVDDARWTQFEAKQTAVATETERLARARVRPEALDPERAAAFPGGAPTRETTALDLLRRPEVSYPDLVALGCIEGPGAPPEVAWHIEVRTRYDGYIRRQQQEIERQRRHQTAPLPDDLDYAAVRGLSHEVRQKLAAARPATLGQAARLPGVTPAAVSLLMVHLKRRRDPDGEVA